jgi:uncharacterized protein (TIGR03435 family)
MMNSMHRKAGAAALFSVWLAICSGQTIPAQPQFDVASIRRSDSTNTEKSMTVPGGTEFIAQNYSLQDLVKLGWGVRSFQLLGGPKWFDSDRYNVDAKSAVPLDVHTPDNDGLNRLQHMVQSLLADRFRLRVHRETREMGIYFLTVGRNGATLKRSAEGTGTTMHGGNGDLVATATNIHVLAANLGGELGVPVIDKTGLDGLYDFRLEWSPDQQITASALDTRPSLFAALQEQLGLKLESGRGSVEIVAIDNAEKPTAN